MAEQILKYRKVKSVTRPVLKIEGSKGAVFTVQSAIRVADKTQSGRAQKDAAGNELPPPELMDVVNLETGEESVIVVNTVLGMNLKEHYPNDSYVGKSFEVAKFAPANGKRYATFSISEIEFDTPEITDVTPTPAKTGKGK